MRRRKLISSLLASLVFATPLHAVEIDGPQTIVTSESQFAIPFQAETEKGGNSEVRLYFSEDHGVTWKLHSKAQAPIDSFDFKADGEKEYWFAVRTLDATGKESPSEPPSAELAVVVDRTPPKLELTAEPTAQGEVAVRWKVDDPHLAADSLKLTYRTGDGRGAELLAERTKRQGDDRSASGEVLWTPVQDQTGVVIRAEIRDAADNVVVKELPLSALSAQSVIPSPTALAAPGPLPSPPTNSVATPHPAPTMSIRDPNKPLMVNSTSFELDYDVQRAVGASITKVEIWGTRDEGRTWVLLGLDEDRRSPCAVNVDTAGMYGFAVVVEAGDGLKGRVPQSGDAPEIRVGVDLTIPRVRLTTAEPDPQGRPCVMRINWDALDENLGPQAVTLSWAASPHGPWTPVAQGIASSGGHVCEFDPQGPDYVYLKIDVRDEAGNVGSQTTKTAIPVEKRQVQFTFAGNNNTAAPARPKWFHVLQ